MFSTVRRRKERPREQAPGRQAGGVCRRTGGSKSSGHERQRDALWSGWRDGEQQRQPMEHQESELLHTTDEGGELNPGGPAGGKGEAGSRN
jgi:hypothetical protein